MKLKQMPSNTTLKAQEIAVEMRRKGVFVASIVPYSGRGTRHRHESHNLRRHQDWR